MISSNLMGGLGNFLFQIAAGYSKSLDMGTPFLINPNNVYAVHRPLVSYTKNILRNITFDNYNFNNVYTEPFFHFNQIPNFNEPTLLNGYFQSEKYFIKNTFEIQNLYKPTEEIIKKLYKKYDELEKNESCSIHIRRGDYLNLQNHHPIQSISYYKKSVELIGLDKHFFIFSDDIEWCKNNLNFLKNKTFVENDEDFEDLYLMSLCEHNIIANSSFSWWGAWLNKNKNKKIVSPKKWFGISKYNFKTKDIYAENWFII